MANETESATIRKVVDYLRKEAAKFDELIKEGEDHGGDVTWAKVKRMTLNVMADRIERGDWKAE
jgi:hypothetical protein